MIFEWDAGKAKMNLEKHGVAFDEARAAFDDLNAVDSVDETDAEIELRYNLIGLTAKGLLFVVYTERRGDVIRLVSARKVTKFEEEIYVAK